MELLLRPGTRVCLSMKLPPPYVRGGDREDDLLHLYEFFMHPGQSVIYGRMASNEIVIARGNIARRHGRFALSSDGHLLVIDHNTTNGTFLNGKRIVHEARFTHEDTVYVGDAVFRVATHRTADALGENALLSVDEQIVWFRDVIHGDLARHPREYSKSAPRRVDEAAEHYFRENMKVDPKVHWFASALTFEQQVWCGDFERQEWFVSGQCVARQLSNMPARLIGDQPGESNLYRIESWKDEVGIVTHRYPREVVGALLDAMGPAKDSYAAPVEQIVRDEAFRIAFEALDHDRYRL